MPKTLYVTDRDAWRAWLAKNHDTQAQVWLIYYKKHTGQPRIPYEDAVEEALCFGWIDSLVQRIDHERYAQKFTPRKVTSRWSELNKRRVKKMIREGTMTPAGLAKIPEYVLQGEVDSAMERPKKAPGLPRPIALAIRGNRRAWDNFNHLAPSYRRNYVAWITAAKRDETRERRIKEAIGLLARGRKLGMK